MHTSSDTSPGTPVQAIDTPALVIDLDAMERNIQRMAEFARQHRIAWRPHAKMHKCAALARQLIAAGATGVCVQKTAEAEAMAAQGVTDIYISNEVIAPHKLRRVAALARNLQECGGRLSLAVDSAQGIAALVHALENERLTQPLDVLVEVNVGHNRCGVEPGLPAVALARAIATQPMLHLAGLQAYHGGAQHISDANERAATLAGVIHKVRITLDALQAAGFAITHVTGAGTGSFLQETESGVYTELQPGSFLFMDADYARNQPWNGQPLFEQALFVKTQVISRSADHAVCDAGHKSHAIDSGLPLVWNPMGAPVYNYGNGGDEHGLIRCRSNPDTETPLPAIGDALWLIPGHCDPTVNLHDTMSGVRGGLIDGTTERIFTVDARGALT